MASTQAKNQNCTQLYNRARYYDTSTGEFCSRDPLEYFDGMSLMRAYMAMQWIDPTGKHLEELGQNEDGQNVYRDLHSGNCHVCDPENGEILPGYENTFGGRFRPCECEDVLDKESFKIRERLFRDGNKIVKNAEFDFKVLGNEASPCCFAQFVKGKMINISTGEVLQKTNCGEKVDMDFPEWVIDSKDEDPIWGTNPTETDGVFTFGDKPTLPRGSQRIDYKFKMCVFNCDEVPKTCADADFANAIKCIDWEFSGSYTRDGIVFVNGTQVFPNDLPIR